MLDTTYFLPIEQVEMFNQHGFASSIFEVPTLLPKVGNKKAQSIWKEPNNSIVAKMLNIIDLDPDILAPLIGMSAKTTFIYLKGESDHEIRYSSWVLICRLAAMKLQGKKLPKPKSYIFDPRERAVLLRFFGEETMRYPESAENNTDGSAIWDHTPSIETVAKALHFLAENGYRVPQMMKVWNIEDRTVRRKKTQSPLLFAQFILMCEVILHVTG
ncbi:hypothetical protein OPW39_15670 [Vibrio europaeus]|uniref:hypothetical protein n=1 Tax=Vibrio europaeus TaxID=300876 RepID=UPI00233EBD6D|nr:hypothetical protein [Vibrio europaeus]MDC5870246.1 hypothetical protein [Vibrio europaeus]